MGKEINLFELPLEAYHGKLPFPLVNLIQRLTDLKANTVENLFVNPPDSDTANQIINELSKGPIDNWAKFNDISAIAYVFMQYLSKLFSYEPLIPTDSFTVISTMITLDDLEKKINLCQSILSSLLVLQKGRYSLIQYIFHFLKDISNDSSTNNMDASVLSECFTPILSPQNKSSNISEEAANESIEFIIENYEAIFSNSENDPADPKLYEMSSEEINSFHLPIIDFKLVSIAVNNCKYRKNHIIKFIPNATISNSAHFKRPQRAPPPKPVTSSQLAVNMFDSTIQRFRENDNNKKFLINVRHSVNQLNPLDTEKPNSPNRARTKTSKPPLKASSSQPPPSNKPPPPPSNKPAPPPKKDPSPVPVPKKSSKTVIGKDHLKPPTTPAQSGNTKKGTIADRAKLLNIPMGAPMPMAPNRRQTTYDTESPSQAPMGAPMPMGAPRPKVTKDEEDTPINVVLEPGQMIHRTPRRGGNRRPPRILTET